MIVFLSILEIQHLISALKTIFDSLINGLPIKARDYCVDVYVFYSFVSVV